MIRFCKKCGTLYSEKTGPCPKCTERDILAEDPEGHATDAAMGAEEAGRARRRAWIELLIGIPLFIGAIYLIIYLFRLLGA